MAQEKTHTPTGAMDDAELLRYSRQISLPQLDIAGQQRLASAKVAIVGSGGLGQPAGLYLAGAGVGRIVLADGDAADVSNLHRQIALDTQRLGENKADLLAERMRALNPLIQVQVLPSLLAEADMRRLLPDCNLVLDCSDNFASRFALTRAAVATGTPVLSAAVIRAEGQLVLLPSDRKGACYHCLYSPTAATDEESDMEEDSDMEEESCAHSGVLGPVAGVMGAVQALEAVKYLTGAGTSGAGRLMLYDGWKSEWRTLQLQRDLDCAVCGEAT